MELVLILLLVAIKLPLVAYMLWLPFRSDREDLGLVLPGDDGSEEPGDDDGGQRRWRPPHPRPPLPRLPRRGPHGGDGRPSPARVRLRPLHARSRVGH